jgi:hypothetical protein
MGFNQRKLEAEQKAKADAAAWPLLSNFAAGRRPGSFS